MNDMAPNEHNTLIPLNKSVITVFAGLIIIGFGTFVYNLLGQHPERAWQAYLLNFLLWSAIAQGGLLFSAVMHTVKARWSGPLSGLSESFAAFFPVSFVLFLILFIGKNHLFPWIHEDLHGKEVWLNIPFLFSRDTIGLLLLYGFGVVYLYYALGLKLQRNPSETPNRNPLIKLWNTEKWNEDKYRKRMTVFSILYILLFAVILSLIGYDLVMSLDPHWYSTLFGAYSFVKAFYIGLGALIILASIHYKRLGAASGIKPDHLIDLGRLFFAFSLVWADFFYCQFVVIWYGNISEETSYIIERTMVSPWNSLAWTVFIICFIIPFFILLNRNIKTKPIPMILLSGLIIIGIWLEHLLVLGPVFHHDTASIPVGLTEVLITLGFFGLMALALSIFLNLFPELIPVEQKDAAR